MSLRTLLPELPKVLQDALEISGINTAQDVVFSSAHQLHSHLPPAAASLQEIVDLKNQVAERVSALPSRGDEIFKLQTDREIFRDPCLCGVQELDALLGGFGQYGTIEIAGEKKSGRTGLILNIVLRYLCGNPEHTAMWLDIGGEFGIERAAEVLGVYEGPGFETALDRLSIVTCFDIASAHQALESLRASLSSQKSNRLRLFVIDPLTPLFAPLLSAISSQGHAIMVTFMRTLNSLARTYLFTVFVVNSAAQSPPYNPYSAFPMASTKPSLGSTFTFLTDSTIWLFDAMHLVNSKIVAPGDRVFIAEVHRSHTTFAKTWCAFIMRRGTSLHGFSLPQPSII